MCEKCRLLCAPQKTHTHTSRRSPRRQAGDFILYAFAPYMAEERVGWLAVWFVRQNRPRPAKLNLVINIPALTHTQAVLLLSARSLSAEWSLPAVFMIYQPSSLAVSALLAFCLAAKPRKLRLLPHPADEMCSGDLCVCAPEGVAALRWLAPCVFPNPRRDAFRI